MHAVAVLCDLEDLAVRRVDRVLFEGLSLTVRDGDRIGVVGNNGAGKSTLLKIIAGTESPDTGQVRRKRGSRLGYLEQVPTLPRGTVRAVMGDGWEAQAALDRLGVAASLDVDVATLSGGQAKRVSLARVLVHPVELLVLDEPTNHLDLAAVAWLEQRLLSFRGGLVLVTHDRHLLERVSTKMLEIDGDGRTCTRGATPPISRPEPPERTKRWLTRRSRRILARRELAWLRRGAKARSRKPGARVDAAMKLLAGGPDEAPPGTELSTGGTPRLGDKVIECFGVGFTYTPPTPVLRDVVLVVSRAERLGIVGANGSGKSTLLDLLAGRLHPTSGAIEVGSTVVVGYYDQQGVKLDLDARVQEFVRWSPPHSRHAGGHRAHEAIRVRR